MTRQSAMSAFFLGLALSAAALADDDDHSRDGRPLVRFDGGIGSQPLRGGGQPNDVNGVDPGGRPWEIRALRAEVKSDGRIRVDGRGLILGGGGRIGTPAIPRDVSATLFCGGVAHDTNPVPLDAAGDFRIDGALYPAPPSPCEGPVLLIRNNSGGVPGSWFRGRDSETVVLRGAGRWRRASMAAPTPLRVDESHDATLQRNVEGPQSPQLAPVRSPLTQPASISHSGSS